MRLTKINKNKMMENFFIAISAGQGFVEAGKKAGFADVERSVARELHNPEFLPAMSNAIRHRLGGRLAARALQVAESMLESKNTNPRIRWDIAKTILAAGAGFVPPKGKLLDEAPKDIGQMTASDIMQMRAQLEAEMANRAGNAKLIEHQPLDFLD